MSDKPKHFDLFTNILPPDTPLGNYQLTVKPPPKAKPKPKPHK